MQKIFAKYFLLIVIATVLITTFGNAIIQAAFSEHSAKTSGKKMIQEIENRIENNNQIVFNLTRIMNDNYIARAKAFAEIIAHNPNILNDFDEMVRMTEVLNVDEVHVSDEKGVLRWGNVPEYYGLDYANGEQTKAFIPALTDNKFQLAQDPRPNAIEGKFFQYIGVARQDKPGIVQVGITPEILKQALANNEISSIISDFNVTVGETVIAIDKNSGVIVADTNSGLIGKNYKEAGIPKDGFSLKKENTWIIRNKRMHYTVFSGYDKYIIAVSFSAKNLLLESSKQNIVAVISSTLLGLIIIIAIFKLLKKVIINDIERINGDLKSITEGNLEIIITAKSTPEFYVLSNGINEMVSSMKENIKKIANQAKKLEASNKSILSSLNYARRIQSNLLPSPEAFNDVFYDYSILWEPKDVVGGDIYWVKNFEKGSVLCVCDCTGHGTPGALLTMLVVTALETVVTEKNCYEPNAIIWELDQKLINTLNASNDVYDIKDGADLSIIFIDKNGGMLMSSANTRMFVCNGNTVENIRGQKISLGEGSITDKNQIKTTEIPFLSGNKYYIASDGLFDQIGGKDKIPYGYHRFMEIVLENHNLTQEHITHELWDNFKLYMGNECRRDDIVLLTFELKGKGE